MKINYSSYTVQQLLEAKDSINPDVAPENFQRLLEELEKRKGEISEVISEERKEYVESNSRKVNIIAWLQMVGGVIFFIFSLFSSFSLISVLSIFVLSALSILAGWFLLKSTYLGYLLTYINQALQIPVIYSPFLIYDYSTFGGLFFTVNEGGFGFITRFEPGIIFSYDLFGVVNSVSVNIAAISMLILTRRRQIIDSVFDSE